MKARIPGQRALLKPDKQAVRAQCPPVGERAEGLGGVLQALRTARPLGKEEPQRCDSGVERHDSRETEGAKP